MDVVKARLMVARDGDRSGVLACVRDLARTGGPAAFFKGWLPAVLRLLPVALVFGEARETFDAMEALRAFLGAAAY
ncbi:thiosulfate transmembrane transporter [Aureococcus anophagefferens]|nr:thiosulfate transmembrane transporter [Aureococcus anophagefferens]